MASTEEHRLRRYSLTLVRIIIRQPIRQGTPGPATVTSLTNSQWP